jgi:hypothetical protein
MPDEQSLVCGLESGVVSSCLSMVNSPNQKQLQTTDHRLQTVSHVFNDSRNALAAPNTGRYQAIFLVEPLHIIQ